MDAFASTPGTGPGAFDRHVAISTRAPFLLVGVLAPGMTRRGGGAIVTITSSAARMTARVGGAYAASKAGVEILTRYWATEFGGRGIRANAISPGPVFDARGRLGEPHEVAGVVLFLVSPAGSDVNGAVLAAEGGELSVLPGWPGTFSCWAPPVSSVPAWRGTTPPPGTT